MGRIVYQKLQALRGLGDVIDLEYNMNGNVGFDIKCTSATGGYYDTTCILGSKDVDNGYTLGVYVNYYANSSVRSRTCYAKSGATSPTYASAPTSGTFKATKSGSTMQMYIGSSLRSSIAIASFTTNIPIYLFGMHEVSVTNSTDTVSNLTKAVIEYCKIYDNGTLVRDLIPVKRIADDCYGMFDKISKKFFTAKSKDYSKMTGTVIADAYMDINGNSITAINNIVSELTYMKETKNLLKEAMEFKGAIVNPDTPFRSYPELIRNLQMSGALLEEEYNNCLGLTQAIYPNIGMPEAKDPDPEVDPDVEVVTGKFRALNSVYIDTGISPYGKKLRLEFKFGPLLGSYNYVVPFGGYNTKTRQYLPTFKTSKGSGIDKYWSLYLKSGNPLVGYRDLFSLSGMSFGGDTFEGVWETDNEKTFYDLIYTSGSTVKRKTNTIYLAGDFPKATTLMLFAQNTENGVDTNTQSSAYFYYFRIYLDNKIVRSFIPAKKDGVYCLYDKVSKTYFYSLGTGNFSVG
jgi:hypothetical protein